MCENSANFPFRWALICVQASRGRVSAPYSTDAALERDGREGALPPLYMEVQEFPPVTGQPIFIHLTFVSFHRKSWRGGGRGESEEVAGGLERGSLLRHHVNEGDHRRHRLRVTQLISSSQPPFFHSTHTCTWMSTRSYVEMFIHKCYWQGRYSKIKMATFPVWTHDIWRSVCTYVTPGCVVCQAGLCVCGCVCGCVSSILPLRPFPHSFQSN